MNAIRTAMLLLLLGTACGGGTKAAVTVPARAATPGDGLLALLPPGADAIAELDVARLRANSMVGEVVTAIRRRAIAGNDPLGGIDCAVAAVYRVATDSAVTIFVLRGSALPAGLANAEQLDERTLVVAPATERDAVRAVQAGAPSLAADPRFLGLRTQAMPARATGAVLRITARLSQSARVRAAGKLLVDEVPATVSLWFDLADDAALIALLGGDDEADAVRLSELATTARNGLGRWLPAWLPSKTLTGDFTTQTSGRMARIVWTLGPRRLESWAKETARRLEAAKGS